VRPLRLGEEKRKKKIEDRKKSQDENIMVCPITYGDHNKQEVQQTTTTTAAARTTTTICLMALF